MSSTARYVLLFLTVGFLGWFIYTPLPEDMEQKVKVTVIDAGIRTYSIMVGLLSAVGLAKPFSDMDRYLADRFVMLMSTGRPWVQTSDPALQIQDLFTDKNRIRMRMYEPLTTTHQKERPVLVYFHGGGFSVLSIDSYDVFTRNLAKGSGVVVVSVNYRLSPQFPYPVPLDDCIEAVSYLLDHASNLNLDPTRFAVGGDSAGGNLAASISLKLRNRIKAQLLLVPALQFFTFNTTSHLENQQYFSASINNLMQVVFWTNYINCEPKYGLEFIKNNHTSPSLKTSGHAQNVDQNKWMDKSHIRFKNKDDLSQKVDFGRTDIPSDIIDKMTNQFVSPLMASDTSLQGLPRAYVMVAGYDLIRDEGIMYARRLQKAGVSTHFTNHRTSFHNALLFIEGPLELNTAKQIMNDIVSFLQVYA